MSTPLKTFLRYARALPDAVGQANFMTAGTFSWVVPLGVDSVSVVCVAAGAPPSSSYTSITDCRSVVLALGTQVGRRGGGLRYENDISVTPGETITVTVGSTSQFKDSSTVYVTERGTGTPAFDGGGDGGAGGLGGSTALGFGGYGGHGGAGGFTGNGGNGADAGDPCFTRPAGTGDGGNGGDAQALGATEAECLPDFACQSRTGAAGIVVPGVGERGVGGTNNQAGLGVVRILWPGSARQYPSTRVTDE